MTARARLLVLLAAVVLAAGCGAGSGEGLDSTGNLLGQSQSAGTGSSGGGGGGGGGAASGNPNATLAWVQSNVFGGVCTQCHTGAGAPFGVDWSSTAGTCANVGRPSGQIPTLNEITASNPATSYVIWKVEGQGPLGEPIAPQTVRMPMANPALAPETIQNMKDWIADGVPGC